VTALHHNSVTCLESELQVTPARESQQITFFGCVWCAWKQSSLAPTFPGNLTAFIVFHFALMLG